MNKVFVLQINQLFCFYFEVVKHRVVTSHHAEQRQRRLTRRAEQLVELRRKEPGDILMTILKLFYNQTRDILMILFNTDAF